MILKELLALCDDGNAMITIIREDGMELENGKASLLYTSSHYPFYDVVSFDMHRGELHICISSDPNWDEKRKFYPISYGITGVTSSKN